MTQPRTRSPALLAGGAEYVPSMYQHNVKQRHTEGNSGQHEMRSDQVKAHNPKGAGSNPAPRHSEALVRSTSDQVLSRATATHCNHARVDGCCRAIVEARADDATRAAIVRSHRECAGGCNSDE